MSVQFERIPPPSSLQLQFLMRNALRQTESDPPSCLSPLSWVVQLTAGEEEKKEEEEEEETPYVDRQTAQAE